MPIGHPDGGQQIIPLARPRRLRPGRGRTHEPGDRRRRTRPTLSSDLYLHTLLPLRPAGIAAVRIDHEGKDPGRGHGQRRPRGDVDTILGDLCHAQRRPAGRAWRGRGDGNADVRVIAVA